MGRRLLTYDEKVARHVKKHNAKEVAAMPLFADQIEKLSEIGVVRLRTEEGVKAQHKARFDYWATHRAKQLKDALRYEAWVMENSPEIHAIEKAQHERVAIRAPSLLEPHYLADHWWGVIRKNWGDLQARIVFHNDEALGRSEWERMGRLP
jgi:hypothetical protein